MTARGVFVAGTDTGIGKTRASALLVRAERACGRRAIGMKPVASGCVETRDGLRNEDAQALIAASDPAPPYALCNPYAFAPPIAPHIAAREAGIAIALDPLVDAYRMLAGMADRVVVEGVGGWCVPLSDALMQADLVHALEVPVVLVVGLRLGCISHALLSARAIVADRCVLAGWIANRIDPDMARDDENLATLSARIDA
ncbi:MAG TPA: dethiobiotin synthase, partial [Rhodanobacteraceae bacterium]|nr:dethiobiotin synthase [Rhodanobacteraceae bacterium]